uniref:Uncharacterized protein n=1 Tax=Arundo donax TaxID=35708 RepID=A0A0A9BAF5_ARUDO
MTRHVTSSRLAFLVLTGGGPPSASFGAIWSSPTPNAACRKNSASVYSRFSANCTGSTS